MHAPLEHDYIGLPASSSMERSSESSTDNETNTLNLKATELRLGLPGFSHDLVQNDSKTVSIKNFVPGAKRVFSDVDNCRNWRFNGGSEADLSNVSDVKLVEEKKGVVLSNGNGSGRPAAKLCNRAQVVGWPPIRSFRKNTMATNSSKNDDVTEYSGSGGCLYVKVSMDGAPYLRKVDLKTYQNYAQLSEALEKLFSCFTLGKCTSNGLQGGEGFGENNVKELLHGSESECVLTYEDRDGDWMLVGDVPWQMFIDSCKRLRIMKGSEAIGLAPRSMEKCKDTN